jgi:hypothetical protein
MHIVVFAALALMACSGQEEKMRDSATSATDTSATSSSSTTQSNTTQTGTTSTSGGVTYYEDAAPIFADRCAGCHQAGGIGPFALDDYALAAAFAPVIKLSVENRSMPPWLVTDDGTCQTFNHSRALTDQEIETIAAWADEGAQEGNPDNGPEWSRELPSLARVDATYSTPNFTPEIQGGTLAAFDEYRCFVMDNPHDERVFLRGYEVTAGTPEIVHHVVSYKVDLERNSWNSGRTNAEEMELLRGEGGRDGWPCFSGPGGSLRDSGSPIVWAPGQGAAVYPEGVGISWRPSEVLVSQVHYNLSDPTTIGLSDTTRIDLMTETKVERIGKFALLDPYLETLYGSPALLPPGQEDVSYTWTMSGGSAMGNAGISGDQEDVQISAILPHMHERGARQNAVLETSEGDVCLAEVNDWDFNWQLMYEYASPVPLERGDEIEVTCHWDTSMDTNPILPGWGTNNEMCLFVMLLTYPSE